MSSSEYKRQYRAKLRLTEEGREKLRAWERTAYERRVSTAKGREHERAKGRKAYARKASTPEGRAWLLELWRTKRLRRKGRAAPCPAPYVNAAFNDELYARIHKLAACYGHSVRDDIIGEVYLGVLEGVYPAEVTSEHVKDAARKLRKDEYKLVSLNAPRGETTLGQLMGVY